MRPLVYTLLLLLAACKTKINLDAIERREHELSYLKGTNNLVDGQVIRKFDNGKIAELHNYKDGKPIGDWFVYGFQGEIVSHGFGVDAKKYETRLPNNDFSYSHLSINIEGSFAYATMYLDNLAYFENPKILLGLSKEIYKDYYDKYKIEDIYIFNGQHEYTISKSATLSDSYKIDTLSGNGMKSHFY